MEDCKTCEHVVFDEKWGEYKCAKRKTRIYILLNPDECKDYKKKKENK